MLFSTGCGECFSYNTVNDYKTTTLNQWYCYVCTVPVSCSMVPLISQDHCSNDKGKRCPRIQESGQKPIEMFKLDLTTRLFLGQGLETVQIKWTTGRWTPRIQMFKTLHEGSACFPYNNTWWHKSHWIIASWKLKDSSNCRKVASQ